MQQRGTVARCCCEKVKPSGELLVLDFIDRDQWDAFHFRALEPTAEFLGWLDIPNPGDTPFEIGIEDRPNPLGYHEHGQVTPAISGNKFYNLVTMEFFTLEELIGGSFTGVPAQADELEIARVPQVDFQPFTGPPGDTCTEFYANWAGYTKITVPPAPAFAFVVSLATLWDEYIASADTEFNLGFRILPRPVGIDPGDRFLATQGTNFRLRFLQ